MRLTNPTLLCSLLALTLCAGCDEPRPQLEPDMAIPDMELPPPPRCGDGEVNQPDEACDDGNDDDSDACLSSCELARCGDGALQVGVEACDDGNDDDTDACPSTCELARCGDGYARTDLTFGEEGFEGCDDGNSDDSDACLSSCELARCGDGVVHAELEACDDGNSDDHDACLSTCQLNECGDGVLRRGVEACDDGNLSDEDGCTSACALNVCGDGLVFAGAERCDEGEGNSDEGACTLSCERARCGDGLLRADLSEGEPGFEGCDDGNSDDTDACRNDCAPARCGDGVVRADLPSTHPDFEQCDPANPNPNAPACDDDCVLIECGNGKTQADEQCDAGPEGDERCDAECVLIECGNGKLQLGEACDAGLSAVFPDRCRPDCTLPRCGDGVLDLRAGEQCDEGPNGGDACRASCVLKRCGDGVVDVYEDPSREDEQCDDANLNERDACNSACQLHVCGDGVVRAGLAEGEPGFEACDWGQDNSLEPDHCRPSCALPRCGDGVVDDGEACDDGDDDETNGCNSACEVSWCGDGALNSYLLSSGAPQASCEGLTGCVSEECEPSLAEVGRCDEGCTLTSYALSSGDQTHLNKVAPEGSEDRYTFTLSAPSELHLVVRRSDEPFERCDEALYRELTLERLDEQGVVFEELTPSASGDDLRAQGELGGLGDVGVCGALQASLLAGRYQVRVSGAGDQRERYQLRSVLSQDISARGAFTTQLVSSGEPITAGLFHFTISEDDLERTSEAIDSERTPRRARLIFHSSSLPEGVSAPSACPALSLSLARGLSALTELERPHVSQPVTLQQVTGLRDQATCAYEASLGAGLYQLAFNPSSVVYQALQYQWSASCGDAQLDPGEGCDLGARGERFPCSHLCLSDPVGTPEDGVCDPSEAHDSTPDSTQDCELTCSLAEGGCVSLWPSAAIDERVVQLSDELNAYTFELTRSQQLYASLSYCSADLALELHKASGELVASSRGLGRERCAQLDLPLTPGSYTLSVNTSSAQSDGTSRVSYWLEALKVQPLSERQLISAALPAELTPDELTSPVAPSLMPTAFELSLAQRENVELMIFDDDNTRQCESLNAYSLTLYELSEEGALKRDLSGQLASRALSSAGPQYQSGTAPFWEEVPCALTALTLEAGRYVVAVAGEPHLTPEAGFAIQALTPRRCGDGRLDAGEECDDGNLSSGDGCTKYCVKEPRCGDGVLDRGEQCDDGNTRDADLTCSSACTLCGDGVLQAWEQCDDGNTRSGDGCDKVCSQEVVSVVNAITHHSGLLKQATYETREGSEQRPLSERADVYLLNLSAEASVSALLCAPRLRTTEAPLDQGAALREQLSARARLVPLTGLEPPLEQLAQRPEPSALEGDEALTLSPLELSLELDPSVTLSALNALVSCEGEPANSQPSALSSAEQYRGWVEDEQLACLKMTWPQLDQGGEYALIVEAAESWPLYRDHTIRYDLNLMTWRPLWTNSTPNLGVLSGDLPAHGDVLFKLSTPETGSTEPSLYEARTIDQEHFSCPLDTATTLHTFSAFDGSCAVSSKLSEASPCASTRLSFAPNSDYFIRLSPRDPEEGLSSYHLKLRSVTACGDGELDFGEECDDGNLNDLDACSKVCTKTYLLCGNRELDEGEQCDDGNTLDGDGCSAQCVSERCLEIDGERVCRVWLLDAAQEVSLELPLGAVADPSAPGYTPPLFSVVRYLAELRNAQGNRAPLLGSLEVSGDPLSEPNASVEVSCGPLNDDLTPLSHFSPYQPPLPNEDLMSCELAFEGWSQGAHFSYRAAYKLTSSAQIFGRLLSFGSDLFELNLNRLNVVDAFNPPPLNDEPLEALEPAPVLLRVAVVDPTQLELANVDDPPCSDDLDTSLTLLNSEGEVLLERDDVSATNLCSAFYTFIEYERCAPSMTDYEACKARNIYQLKVSNRSLKTSSYQLQVTLPELLCGNELLDFGELCDISDPLRCDARCQPVVEAP